MRINIKLQLRYIKILFLILISSIITAKASNETINPDFTSSKKGYFIENKGQIISMEDKKQIPSILYYSNSDNLNLYIKNNSISYLFINSISDEPSNDPHVISQLNANYFWSRIDMVLEGANSNAKAFADDEQSYYMNFYLPQCPNGLTNLKTFKKITIKDVYPKIDWIIYFKDDGVFKYDFIVNPGGNPKDIKINYKWSDKPEINSDNEILINGPMGSLSEKGLYISQDNKTVNGSWVKDEKGMLSFNISAYNKNSILVIDPIIFWSTYFGGTANDDGLSIKSDGSSVFVTGRILSVNFPAMAPSGAYNQGNSAGNDDAFIAKFDSSGTLLWSTHYGGSGYEVQENISFNTNSVFLTFQTISMDEPTMDLGGGAFYQAANPNILTSDAFIIQFNKSGVREWATYLGGFLYDLPFATWADNNNLFLLMGSESSGLPLTNPGSSYQQNQNAGPNDFYIVKFNAQRNIVWSTYFGGTGDEKGNADIKSDGTNVFVTGSTMSTNFPLAYPGAPAYMDSTANGNEDLIFAKFDFNGGLLWSTYYGGSNRENTRTIALANNKVLFGGNTYSSDIPTFKLNNSVFCQTAIGSNIISDGFIAGFNSNTCEREWATYLGGALNDNIKTIQSDGKSLWVVGQTSSTNFPTRNPLMGNYFKGNISGSSDGFIAKFKIANDSLQWSTYWGGLGAEDAVGVYSDGAYVWATGYTTSTDMPLVNAGGLSYNQPSLSGGKDVFVLKFDVCIKPNVTISNITPSICYGDTMMLVAGGAQSYIWAPIGYANDTLSFTPPITFNYVVTGTDDMNCSNIANSIVVVNPKPILQISAPDSTCFGTPYTLNIISNLPSTYLWNPGNGIDSSFIVNPDTASHTFYYSVIVTDTVNGCKDTATTSIFVNALPQLLITSPDSTCYGTPYTIHVTSNLPSTYQWSPGIGIDSIYTVNPDTVGNTFSYSVIVTDTINGCRDTATTTIFVNGKPDVYITGAGSFCPDTTINIQVHDIYNLPLTYDWHPTNTPDSIITFNLNTPNISYFDTVYVETPLGCRDTATSVIVVWPIPTVNITPNDTAICFGQPIDLNITSNIPANLFWTIPDTIMNSNTTLYPDSIGYTYSYIAHAIDSIHGCKNLDSVFVFVNEKPVLSLNSINLICPYETITLAASSSIPVSYLWTPSNDTNSFIIFHPNTADTTYSYSLIGNTVNNCKDTATTFIVVYPSINVSITPLDSALCLLDSITLYGHGGNTYEWYNNTNLLATTPEMIISPTNNTTYTLIGTSTELCKDTTTTFVTIYSLPKFNVLGNNHICKGNSTLFQVDSTFDNTITYLWQPGNLNGDSVILSPQDTTNYSVIGTDTNTCHFTVNFQINVDTLPIAKITGIHTICYGATTELQASGGTNFLWLPSNSTTPVISVTPDSSSIFTYTLIANSTICYDTTTFLLTVNPKPVLTLTHDTTLIIGQYVQLNTTGAQFYDWSPINDLSCIDCPNPVAKPYSTIEYCVIGKNGYDCSDTACINITVDTECGEVFVPSGFSPNGDGQNDIMYVYGKCVKSMEFKIYNRWGEKVFETSDPDIGWDGVYKGKAADTDVFVYFLKAEYFIGTKVETKGNITLMR